MKIGIIRYGIDELKKRNIDFETTEEYKIEKALKKKKIDFEVFVTPERFYEIDKKFIQKTFGKYNIILNRDKAHYRSQGLIKIISEHIDVPIVNSAEVGANCWDKLVTTLLFSKNNIPTPKTIIVNENVDLALDVIEEKLGYPVVIKTSIGSHGNAVHIVDNYEQAKKILNRLSKGHFYKKEFYIQEYIKEGDKDIRCFVIGDEVVAQYMRVAAKNERRSNIHLGGKGIEYKLNKDLERLALKAAKVVGGGILGVDIFKTKESYKVNEINEIPEFNECSKFTKNIPDKIVEYLLKKSL